MASKQVAVEVTSDATAETGGKARVSSRLMVGLAAGHAVKHFYQAGLLMLLPDIKAGLNLSDIAIGGIVATRQVASGAANIPAGVLTDMFRRRVALMLTFSMACLTVGYLFVGISPWYWAILLAVTISGAGTSTWHAPAFATLAERYPDRRAFAMAMHRSGGSVGDTVAPIVVGLLLGGISFWGLNWGGFGWRTVALIHVVPSAMTAVVILATFKSGGRDAPAKVPFADYLKSAKPLLRNTRVLSMVVMHAIRGMAHQSFQVFLILHMKEALGYSTLVVGYHIALLTLLGIVSAPLLGIVSDRVGRRPVIFFGMSAIALLLFGFTWADSGWPLVLVLALLGVILFSVNPVITATAMDATRRGAEGSAIAMVFTGGAIIGALAPVAAGAIFANWAFQGVVLFAGAIALVGALLAAVVPMARPGAREAETVPSRRPGRAPAD